MSILEVNNVTKIYPATHKTKREIVAVDHLSFCVNQGEIVGFVGPNGAGKSTMLKIVTGLASPTSGTVTVNGADIRNRKKALAAVGSIIENPDMYSDWTGEENLKYCFELQSDDRYKKEEKEDRVKELLHLVGLSDRAKSKVKTYSLGMKQRLGIAQALISRPELLILDEPTNGLDPSGIIEIRDILKHLASSYNMAILVSSHLLAEMQLMCNRFIIIDKGKKIADLKEDDLNVTSSTSYVLKVDDIVKAKDILSEQLSITAEAVASETLSFDTDVSSGDITKTLILGGVNVFGLETKKRTLEEMFMKATGHKEE